MPPEVTASTRVTPPVAPPEPDLTPRELIARATALQPLLRASQAQTEVLTRPTDEVHRACLDAGIYRCYVPRRYGGYEFDALTFMRIVQELARGCMDTGWCVGLAAAHALQVASWWEPEAQDEIFGDGDFRAAAVAAPIGPAERVGDEWDLTGRVAYCSGIPFSTHYMGQAMIARDGRPTDRMLLFVAPRSEFEIVDDWGRLMGLKGTGSNTITFDHGRIPSHWAIEDALMVDFDVSEGTPGARLHGNPLYAGRAMACFTLTLAAAGIGGAYQALDLYEEMLDSRLTPLAPMVTRRGDQTYQRWFGSALVKLGTAEAALINATEQHMEACRRAVEEGIPYTYGEDMRIGAIAREVIVQIWEIAQGEIFRTAGSSATADGTQFERLYRNLSQLNNHRNTLLREWAFGEVAREHLGLPRLAGGNVQAPRR